MNRLAVQLLIVTGVCLITLFLGIGRRGLWNPVEPRYAGISAEMARHGLEMIPTYGGKFYDQKPPLFFWMTAASLKSELADRHALARFPSALGGLLLALGTVLLGHRFWGGRAGLLAGCLLPTTWLVFWSSRFCHMDTLMSASILWALLGFFSAATSSGGRRLTWILMSAFFVTAGIMFKGPAALLFPVGTIVFLALWERDLSLVFRSGVLWAAPLSIAVAGIWFFLAWGIAGSEWAHELLLSEGLLRLVDPMTDKHGRLYYLAVFWGMGGPWSLLLPPALFFLLRGSLDQEGRFGTRACVVWIVFILGILWLDRSPRSRYLLPILPPLVLLVGRWLDVAVIQGRHGFSVNVFRIVCLVIVGCTAALATLVMVSTPGDVPFVSGPVADVIAAVAQSGSAVPFCLVLLVASACGGLFAVRGRCGPALSSSVAALAGCTLLWAFCGAGAVDDYRGDAELLAALEAPLSEGRKLVIVGHYGVRESTEGFFRFHLEDGYRVVGTRGRELAELFSREPLCVLIADKERRRSPGAIPRDFLRSAKSPLGHAQLHLYTNPWPPESE